MPHQERVLVTGGAGMLGLEIVNRHLEQGDFVRVLDLDPVEDPRIESIVGDVRNAQDVEAACRGIDGVYHAAAAVWNPKLPHSIYDQVNVEGTGLVIDACRRHKIRRLVFTSSMDVVVDGRKPIDDGDESLPYPSRLPRDPYSRSKILAEKLVLGSNSAELATCVLRPTGMYGPRDRYHLPNFISVARSRANLRLGDGTARFSHVYSENVAHAHLLAMEKLFPGSPVAGQCYFIADYKPDLNLFDFMEPLLEELGYAPPRRTISYRLAYFLASLSELFAPRAPFNRFSVIQTCVDHTFVFDKATRDFGYEPIVSREEAFKRTIAWAREKLAAAAPPPERDGELERRLR